VGLFIYIAPKIPPHPLLNTCRGRLCPSPARGEGIICLPSLDGRGLRGG